MARKRYKPEEIVAKSGDRSIFVAVLDQYKLRAATSTTGPPTIFKATVRYRTKAVSWDIKLPMALLATNHFFCVCCWRTLSPHSICSRSES
jgi:hypothetical protein